MPWGLTFSDLSEGWYPVLNQPLNLEFKTDLSTSRYTPKYGWNHLQTWCCVWGTASNDCSSLTTHYCGIVNIKAFNKLTEKSNDARTGIPLPPFFSLQKGNVKGILMNFHITKKVWSDNLVDVGSIWQFNEVSEWTVQKVTVQLSTPMQQAKSILFIISKGPDHFLPINQST